MIRAHRDKHFELSYVKFCPKIKKLVILYFIYLVVLINTFVSKWSILLAYNSFCNIPDERSVIVQTNEICSSGYAIHSSLLQTF